MKRLSSKTDLAKWTDAELRERLDIEVAKFNRYRLGRSDVAMGRVIEAELSCRQLGKEIKRRKGV